MKLLFLIALIALIFTVLALSAPASAESAHQKSLNRSTVQKVKRMHYSSKRIERQQKENQKKIETLIRKMNIATNPNIHHEYVYPINPSSPEARKW